MYCWAQYPWVLSVSLAVTLDSTETPFAKIGDAPEQLNRDMFKPFRSHNGLLG